jgi:hypothetical protein
MVAVAAGGTQEMVDAEGGRRGWTPSRYHATKENMEEKEKMTKKKAQDEAHAPERLMRSDSEHERMRRVTAMTAEAHHNEELHANELYEEMLRSKDENKAPGNWILARNFLGK